MAGGHGACSMRAWKNLWLRVLSSVGRAPVSKTEGRWFKSSSTRHTAALRGGFSCARHQRFSPCMEKIRFLLLAYALYRYFFGERK